MSLIFQDNLQTFIYKYIGYVTVNFYFKLKISQLGFKNQTEPMPKSSVETFRKKTNTQYFCVNIVKGRKGEGCKKSYIHMETRGDI